jgi:hypothetical protein
LPEAIGTQIIQAGRMVGVFVGEQYAGEAVYSFAQ